MVFAQLDWLTWSLLQAPEVMANKIWRRRDLRRQGDPSQEAARVSPAIWPNARR